MDSVTAITNLSLAIETGVKIVVMNGWVLLIPASLWMVHVFFGRSR